MTLAIIPARAGSKGIKNKNLALLDGKPLLYYTFEAAKKATCIDEIVLSSDSKEYLAYAKENNIKPLLRPQELATDNARSDGLILHALTHFEGFENIILLQPTSPFRTHKHIDEAFHKFQSEHANSLMSVKLADKELLKAFILDENGDLKGICNNDFPFTPRQALPEVFMSNGAIYIVKTELFKKHKSFLIPKSLPYIMSEKESLDINTKEDLEKANQILKEKQ
ncbi:acylneuraminate cytidylyltransferase [Campylobacter sp. MIT 12-8780]|uniref:acylneuraminate cytidylyltransferase family protein n=1 Tax=unclassified Campylobacter TaxID=2593542 RepID=UPI00115CA245|nr:MULTISPECIES: acylneuraminate cytidylyltransferase family protein [unclassified Campylobacter]NDJ28025.1 acylneuraminate cytidylyltransferase family protein [Campylobacter sp. MIT 19-121]TQR40514.1 acylneuraminate cytidylyltransferase [Campylobacter sp. MIT 12-8780]